MPHLSFDEYADRVREAELDFLMTGPSQAPWAINQCEINSIVLQFGAEGASKIVHGLSRPDALLFIIQYATFADRVIFDGQEAQPHDFAVLPPSSYFTAATFGPNRWMSISLPIGLLERAAARIGINGLEWLEKEKWLVSTSPEILERLTTEAESVAALFEKGEPLRSRLGEIESSLLNLLVGTVEGERKKSSLADSAAKPSRHIMRKALEYVLRHKWQSLYVGDLARAAKVTDRTLRRSFNHELAVAPKRYLKLRELNVVRRALRGKLGNSQKIRTIMSEHGVSEFGRFAVEYKALFGESPSETLRRKAAWSD